MESSLSTTDLEDVAKAVPEGLKWFQLYVLKVHIDVLTDTTSIIPDELFRIENSPPRSCNVQRRVVIRPLY